MDQGQGKAILEGYLNRRMRVVISDGRVIDGNFVCTDRDRNMVLGNCEEFFSTSDVRTSINALLPRPMHDHKRFGVWDGVDVLW